LANLSEFSRVETVFLDRDGVLNEKMPEGCYVTRWADFRPLPGVPEAIQMMNRAGLTVIVVSNQRGVSLGLYSVDDVNSIHDAFQDLLKSHGAHVDGYFFCPHDKHQCNCRKPLPGLFEQAATQFPKIHATTSVMIGDSLSDIEFGRNLGMPTVFIDGCQEHRKAGAEVARGLADQTFPTLITAVKAIVAIV